MAAILNLCKWDMIQMLYILIVTFNAFRDLENIGIHTKIILLWFTNIEISIKSIRIAAILNLCKWDMIQMLYVLVNTFNVFRDQENIGIDTKIILLWLIYVEILTKFIRIAAILDLCKLGIFPQLGFWRTFSMAFWILKGYALCKKTFTCN